MRIFLIIQFLLLLMSDMVFATTFLSDQLGDSSTIIIYIDLILGPIQFISGCLILLFQKKYRSTHLIIYFVISVTILAGYVTGSNFDIGYLFKPSLYFSFIVAHYYVFVLYSLTKFNQ